MNHKLKESIAVIALAIVLVLLTSGISSAQDVTSNYMPGTDFTKYHTYKWVTIEGVQYPNQIVDQQIRMAVDTQMTAKGFIKTEADTADLDVAYQAAVTDQKEWNAYGMGGGWRMGGGMATATSSTIQTGTLAVDFYDPARKELVWRGQATKTLNPSKNPEKNQENLNKAVAKLLKSFPPKPKK
jgi:hypothetical protein